MRTSPARRWRFARRRDVDVDFVEEASIQALLDGVSAVDRLSRKRAPK